MIDFVCPSCHQRFSVANHLAGRSGKCKKCGAAITVPQVSAPAPEPAAAPRLPMRTRRLMADAAAMRKTFDAFELIRVKPVTGDPPEVYHVEYHVKGLEKTGSEPTLRELHRVEIQLTSDYPRLAPRCRMLTPVFHPNIDETTICIGDHWAAGERLVDLVVRIGEMIAYQAYNIKSPLNGEAAMWADLHTADLPIDHRDLRPGDEAM
jgi:ubiquitin-protein ligase